MYSTCTCSHAHMCSVHIHEPALPEFLYGWNLQEEVTRTSIKIVVLFKAGP